jgi:hypothetical protein
MFGSGLGLPTYESNIRIKINGLECTALLASSYIGESIQFVAPRSYGLSPSWSFEMGIMASMPMVIQGKAWFRYGAPQARRRAHIVMAYCFSYLCEQSDFCALSWIISRRF